MRHIVVALLFAAGLCAGGRPTSCQVRTDSVLPCNADTGQPAAPTGLGYYGTAHVAVPVLTYLEDGYHTYVLTSTDRGVTWKRGDVPFGPWQGFNYRFYSEYIYYIDSNNLVLTADSGFFFRSTDGGSTWNDQSFETNGAALYCDFFDSASGIVCGWGGITPQITHDAGHTWRPISWNPHYLFRSPKIFSKDSFALVDYASRRIFYISDSERRIDSTPPMYSDVDSGGSRGATVYWTSRPGEAIAYGSHTRSDQFLTSQTFIIATSDGGYHWQTLLDRDTKLATAPTSLSVLNDGTALLSGQGVGFLWTPNWHTGPWYEDSIDYYRVKGGLQRSEVMLTDNHRALGWFDGKVVRFTFPNGIEAVTSPNTVGAGLLCYPNPATNALRVRSDTPLQTARIYNALGELCLVAQLHNESSGQLSVSSLPPGYYELRVAAADGTTLRSRFVIGSR